MLVRKVALSSLLIAVGFLLFATVPVYADQTCEATEVFYEGVAKEALSALEQMSSKVKVYNEHINTAIKKQSAPCYLLNMEVSSNVSAPYDWSGFDLNGATQAGSKVNEIKSAMAGMNLSNVDMDFGPYEFKNNARIAKAKVSLKSFMSSTNTQQIEEDMRTFQQCKAEIFNLQQEQSSIKKLRDDVALYLRTLSSPQSTTCSCDDSGSLKSCSSVSETPEEVAAKDLSCKNLNEYANSTAFCPTCAIFERILLADQKLAKGAFGVLAGGLTKILAIGFLIYLAFQTLTLVSAPSQQPIGKYLTSITVQGFKVLIAVFILTNPEFLYDLALRPIIEGGIDFGLALTESKQADIMAAGAKYTKFDTSNALLSAPFLQKMVGAADCFNQQAAIMPAMGQAMVCNAFENLDWNVIPNIETLIEGVIVVIFGYIVSLSVGFYLLDLTLELGFICCLLPFLVACWPFKLAKEYVKTGWNIFLHIFFNFVMLGVVITAVNAISKRAIAPENDIQVLINALNNNDYEALKDMMRPGGMQMLMLIVCCYICIKLLRDVNNLANKFAGGAGFNISPGIGGVAASTAYSFGKGGAGIALKGLARGADAVGEVSDAMGATGAAKALGDKMGITKVMKFASDKKKQGKQVINNFVGSLGIGANAVERGGRQDDVGAGATKPDDITDKKGAEK